MRVVRAALLALMAVVSASTGAHEMSMAELQLREMSRGDFVVQWGAGEKKAPADVLAPVWPAQCQSQGNLLRCGETGLTGELAVDGVGKMYSAVLLRITWLDGQTKVYTITQGQPSVRLFGSADDQRGMGEIAQAYTTLGIQHILSGTDHILFVLALLFLVGFHKRLVWTITAFTAAHSLTLASSALGFLTLRSPPVEATVALSILLVAGEALRKEETLSRRWPALVAFVFGLVHGLGFAGALKHFGLPENHLTVALLTFNVGVEIGQLLIVAAAWIVYRTVRQFPVMAQARLATLYAIGTFAAYWSISRIVGIVS
jgi:hydrogenase/urease accessory protein HupE